MLLVSGVVMMLWRPCHSREGRAPRLAVALLLTSAAAVWLGSFGVMVGLLSGQSSAFTSAACGVVWRQLLSSHISWWQVAIGTAWVVALPTRGVWSLASNIRRNGQLLRSLRPVETVVNDPVHGEVLVVPGLSTPAVTLGLLRPVVVVDERFWAGAPPLQRDVVLAHEQGHVRGRHGLVDAIMRLLTAGIAPLPAAAETYACLRRHLEALADDAAVRCHDRQTVGVALGRIALAACPAAGLGAAGASVWRVQRLVTASRMQWHDRLLLWSMLLGVAVGLVLATAEVAHALGPVTNASYCVLR
ncbi:MAG: hypothetical protein ACRDYX_14670 [Egibacteraceae bacterium]